MGSERINFTKKALSDIAPPEAGKRIYFYDKKVPGLLLDVTPTGKKSFYLYRKIKGRPERVFIGRFPETTIEQARIRAMELNALVGKGENPQENMRAARAELTLAELFSEYITRHAQKRKTWRDMQKDFERKAKPIANFKLSEISHARAEKLHRQTMEERGPYAANRLVDLLRSVFNKGIQWKLFNGDNPFKGITDFPEHSRERFLSDAEATKLLKALERSEPDLRDFVTIALLTGVRKNNIYEMRWSQVNWDNETWTIPDTKNGTSQVVSLGSFELGTLKARYKKVGKNSDSDFVFPGKGKSGHLTDLSRSWTSLRKELGLMDLTMHDLRRSLGASMASNNANIALVKDALHHKDLKTTVAVYARTRKQAVVDAKESVHKGWFERAGLIEPKEGLKRQSNKPKRKKGGAT